MIALLAVVVHALAPILFESAVVALAGGVAASQQREEQYEGLLECCETVIIRSREPFEGQKVFTTGTPLEALMLRKLDERCDADGVAFGADARILQWALLTSDKKWQPE